MDKILISKAIKDNTLFFVNNDKRIENGFSSYDNSINGRIKILNFSKYKLTEYNITNQLPYNYVQNILVKLDIEYINLNKTGNDLNIFKRGCDLMDLDGFRFDVISTNGFGLESVDEIYEKLGFEDDYYGETKLIPKVKNKLSLFFLVPDEETDYYFYIVDSNIEEIG